MRSATICSKHGVAKPSEHRVVFPDAARVGFAPIRGTPLIFGHAFEGVVIFGEATMTVKAILDAKGRHVMSVAPDAKLSSAVKMLSERRIGAVVVVEGSRIEGILSERDIVRFLGERGPGVLDEPVRAVMTRKVVTCKEADTVGSLMEIMTTGKFRHLPVIEHDKLVGIISIGDVVKLRVQEYEAEQEALRDYIKTA